MNTCTPGASGAQRPASPPQGPRTGARYERLSYGVNTRGVPDDQRLDPTGSGAGTRLIEENGRYTSCAHHIGRGRGAVRVPGRCGGALPREAVRHG